MEKICDNDTEKLNTQKAIRNKYYPILDNCSKPEIYTIMDGGYFNYILKGYVKAAADNLDFSEEAKTALLNEVEWQLSLKTAEEAEAYYNAH